MPSEAPGLTLADYAALPGILAVVWIGALTFYRSETRGKIDRVWSQFEALNERMAVIWGFPSTAAPRANIETRLLEASLILAAERLESTASVAARATRSNRNGAVAAGMVQIIDQATTDIEDASREPAYKRLERCHMVMRHGSAIIDLLEADFERWQRKFVFW
jgi:hypothetical protein